MAGVAGDCAGIGLVEAVYQPLLIQQPRLLILRLLSARTLHQIILRHNLPVLIPAAGVACHELGFEGAEVGGPHLIRLESLRIVLPILLHAAVFQDVHGMTI